MNVWLLAATLLLLGFVPCGWVAFRASSLLDRLVALQLANLLAVLALLLLSIGTQRSSFGDLAVALALLSLPGGLVYVHFLEQDE